MAVVHGLTPSETKALDNLRRKLEEAVAASRSAPTARVTCSTATAGDFSIWGVSLLPPKPNARSDAILLKFLRAREFRVPEALEMIKNSLRWRKEFRVDEIEEEDPTDSEVFGLTTFLDGVDKEGNPVCYNVYGLYADRRLYQKIFGSRERREKFLRWRVRFMEKGIRELSFRPGDDKAMVQVIDLKETQGSSTKELRSTARRMIMIFQDNYPEFVVKNIFINVSLGYYTYHSLFSPLLSQRTRSKFVFARPSRVTETLLRYITPEDIPVQYGGFKREKDEEFSAENGKVSEAFVKGGSIAKVEIGITEPGVTVVWDFTVVGWEVSYKEEFVPEDDCSYRILIPREKKFEKSVRNSFYISEPGKVVITVENKTLKKKRILYRSKSKPTLPLYCLLDSRLVEGLAKALRQDKREPDFKTETSVEEIRRREDEGTEAMEAGARLLSSYAIPHRDLSTSILGLRLHLQAQVRRRRLPVCPPIRASQGVSPLQYRKLGDSELRISEIAMGTMTFGEQNTEIEAHELLSYAFDQGINILDTAETASVFPLTLLSATVPSVLLLFGYGVNLEQCYQNAKVELVRRNMKKEDVEAACSLLHWLRRQATAIAGCGVVCGCGVILATKVSGYSEQSTYLRDNAKVLRVDAANIKESVEKSLKRLSTDYIDLLQIHWPDRYVPLFGEFTYNFEKWRPSVPFAEQLKAFQELINEGKKHDGQLARPIHHNLAKGISLCRQNATLPERVRVATIRTFVDTFSYAFTSANSSPALFTTANSVTSVETLFLPPRGLSYGQQRGARQNSLRRCFRLIAVERLFSSLLVYLTLPSFLCIPRRIDLVEVCHPNNYNIGLLAFSPLGGGILSGKYLDPNSEAARKGRFNFFLGYMNRYHNSLSKEATKLYVQLARNHGLTPVQLALGFVRDRPFVTSSIIGATSLDQLKEDIDVFISTTRPLPLEVVDGIENIFKRYKDPAIL
ncbi:Patellin-4 [Apostasia shenzhenica]|uniref:Patellin-4 n=1 Tax=Apostasia shenzhenica TaxID=1088818 RepID=A0A2I0BBN8_9ASPA|nr:Patellin-4 [Apostasia shenzhenica]